MSTVSSIAFIIGVALISGWIGNWSGYEKGFNDGLNVGRTIHNWGEEEKE